MRTRRAAAITAIGALLLGGTGLSTPAAMAEPFGYDNLTAIQKRHVSGALTEALGPRSAAWTVQDVRRTQAPPGCDATRGDNVKVNQDCLTVTDLPLAGRGQGQNETWVSVNPRDTRQVIATYNDYRRGDGTCGVS